MEFTPESEARISRAKRTRPNTHFERCVAALIGSGVGGINSYDSTLIQIVEVLLLTNAEFAIVSEKGVEFSLPCSRDMAPERIWERQWEFPCEISCRKLLFILAIPE
jgi:hypothetical protein